MEITMFPVDSSNLAAIGYDAPTLTLRVRFHSGETWQYPGVSQNVFETFLYSSSKGKFFNTYIRGKYEGYKL